MIGNNEMHLNEATMIQAMQEWLDKRMPGYSPKVTSVSASTNYAGADFIVKTTDREKPAATE